MLLESLNIEKNLNNCKISSWLIEKFYQKNKFQDFDAANQIAKKIRTVLEEIFQNQTLEENQNLYALKIYFLNIDNKKYKDNILKKPINTQLSETTLEDSQNLLQTGQKYNLKNDNFTLYMPNNQNYESFFNYFLIPSNTLNDKEFQKILEENLNYGKILNSQESGIGLKIIGPQLAELRYSNNTTRVFFYTFEINKQKIAIVKKIETNANRNHDQKNYINLDNSIEITKYRELAQDFLQLIEKNQEIRENKQLKIPETTRKVQPKGCTKII